MASMDVGSIKVGSRHRKDMGDIAALAASIDEIGLLHPVVVTPTGRLIAGRRRMLAWRESKYAKKSIPVREIDLDKIVRGEYAENALRKDLTMSEKADIADAVEAIERVAAAKRKTEGQSAGGKEKARRASASGEIPRKQKKDDRALDRVGKAVGADRKTIQKARAVRDAAKKDPARFGKLKDDMDRSGKVDGPFKRLNVMQQAEAIRAEPPAFPDKGPYRVLTADPPWPYEARKEDPSHRATHPYPQMSIAQICAEAEKVQAIAHKDCILWLWTTNAHMRHAYEVLDAWGFSERTILTWVKDRMGMGDWLRGQTEHCILAIRGKPVVELTNQTTVLNGPLRENSRKPDEFYAFVEKLCPASRYASLFSRSPRDRWDGHGNDTEKFK